MEDDKYSSQEENDEETEKENDNDSVSKKQEEEQTNLYNLKRKINSYEILKLKLILKLKNNKYSIEDYNSKVNYLQSRIKIAKKKNIHNSSLSYIIYVVISVIALFIGTYI